MKIADFLHRNHTFSIIQIDWIGPTDKSRRFRQQAQVQSSTSCWTGSQPFRRAKISQCLYLEECYLADAHRRGVWSPVCRANLSVRLHELECFHQPERLLHTATDGEIIDTQVLDDPVWIDDEETSVMQQEIKECK